MFSRRSLTLHVDRNRVRFIARHNLRQHIAARAQPFCPVLLQLRPLDAAQRADTQQIGAAHLHLERFAALVNGHGGVLWMGEVYLVVVLRSPVGGKQLFGFGLHALGQVQLNAQLGNAGRFGQIQDLFDGSSLSHVFGLAEFDALQCFGLNFMYIVC